MKTKYLLTLVLTAVFVASVSTAQVNEQSKENQTSNTEEKPPASVPQLADIIPLSAELTGRLVALENKIQDVLDFSAIEKEFAEIETNLEELATTFKILKDTNDYNYNKILECRELISQETKLFEKAGKPLSHSISQLDTLRNQWLAEKKKWNKWQSYILRDSHLDRIKLTFEDANAAIDKALNLISSNLESMLNVQNRAGKIQATISTFSAKLENLILSRRRSVLYEISPSMFSFQYLSQFEKGLWYEIRTGIAESLWSNSRFISRQGPIFLVQIFISLFLIISIYRKRQALRESKHWDFLAGRLISGSLFLVSLTTVLIYEYRGAPPVSKFANIIIAGICFSRLVGGLDVASWKRHFVYVLVAVFLFTNLLILLDFPIPLFRLYMVITSLTGVVLCLRWAAISARNQEPHVYKWSLYLGSLFLFLIIIGEIGGKKVLSSYPFISFIDSLVISLFFMLLLYMIHGGLEWLFRSSPLRRAVVLHSDDTGIIIQRIKHFVDIVILGLVLLPIILVIWGVYNSMDKAIKGLLELGFNIGSQRISVGGAVEKVHYSR